MTITTATPAAKALNPIEGRAITLQLDPDRPDQKIAAQIQHWAYEAPGFPALTDILLSESLDTGMVNLTPAKARLLIPALHQFADQLAELTEEADAVHAEHQDGAQ